VVPKVDHGVVCILGHARASAEFGAVLDEELARRGVLVFEIAGIALWFSRCERAVEMNCGGVRTTLASNQWYGRNSSRFGSMWALSRCSSTPSRSYINTYFFCATAKCEWSCKNLKWPK
jgi:hypothetical protein